MLPGAEFTLLSLDLLLAFRCLQLASLFYVLNLPSSFYLFEPLFFRLALLIRSFPLLTDFLQFLPLFQALIFAFSFPLHP